jgi:hypothetical protein
MPPERSAPKNAAGLSISGFVRNTFGNPVRGAVVACAGEDGKEARSGRDGRYRIENLPERIFALTATHPAYFREQKLWFWPGQTAQISLCRSGPASKCKPSATTPRNPFRTISSTSGTPWMRPDQLRDEMGSAPGYRIRLEG